MGEELMAGSEAGTDSPWRWQEGPIDQHQTTASNLYSQIQWALAIRER